MVTPTCPKCSRAIFGDDINVAADVAFCRSCNLAHTFSSLAQGSGISPDVDLSRPPEGAWHRPSPLGATIGASHRSMAGAVFMFAFAGFWNGVISIFVFLALAATLGHLGVEPPAFLPEPIMNGKPMGVSATLFLWVFLTPFILIGLTLIAAFLSCLAGRTEARIRDPYGEIFTGIGSFGFKRRFARAAVKDVRIDEREWRDRRGRRRRKTNIVLEMMEGKPIHLGSSLSDERRQFVAAALRSTLIR